MRLRDDFLEHELRPESFAQADRVVPLHGKAATALRAGWSERRQHDRAALPECGAQSRNIGQSVVRRCEEVKHGAVVPDVTRRDGPVTRDIGFDPLDTSGPRPQPVLRSSQGQA